MASRNLLIVMSDEHQARAMGNAGHPFVQTPNMDALAARGIRFKNAYTPCPICVPARASFATGLYPHETGHWDNAMPYTGHPNGWGHVLQDAGISVESIGKLHYRRNEDPSGFDQMHIPMHVADGVGMVWASIREEDQRVDMPIRMLGDYIGPGQSPYTQYDGSVADRAVQWLEERAKTDDRPWCLYVSFVAPHFPLVVPQEFYDLYPLDQMPPSKLHPEDGYVRHPWVEKQNAFADSERAFVDADERKRAIASYYGLVSWLDHNLGRVMTSLEACGYSDDTTVIYTSDHGDNLGARGLWGKSTFYEESAAVPLIVAGPGTDQGEIDTPVSLIDVAASIPAHFGLPFSCSGEPLQSVVNQQDPHRVVFSEYHAAGAVSGGFMIRRGRWKLIHYVGFAPELFDLDADPQESRDLASDPAHAAILAELERELRKIVDPEAVNAQAFADQAAMIAGYGGKDAAVKLGAPAATPPPEIN